MADDATKPREADGIQVSGYTDGLCGVELCDGASAIFARALMTQAMLTKHVEQCSHVLKVMSAGGLALMLVRGKA